MKHLKTFETACLPNIPKNMHHNKNFKKYLLLNVSNRLNGNNLVIVYLTSYNNIYKYINLIRYNKEMFTSTRRIDCIKNNNFNEIDNFFIKTTINNINDKIIAQSDNLEELIEFLEIYIDTKNFNL